MHIKSQHGAHNLRDCSPQLSPGTLTQGGTFGFPSYSWAWTNPAKHRAAPALHQILPTPEILGVPSSFGRRNTCERGRSCPHAECSVPGAAGIRSICTGTDSRLMPAGTRHSSSQLDSCTNSHLRLSSQSGLCHTVLETLSWAPLKSSLIHCTGAAGRQTANCRALCSPLFPFSQSGYHPGPSALESSSSQTCTDPYSYITARQGLP